MITKEQIKNLTVTATMEPIVINVGEDLYDKFIDEIIDEYNTIEELKEGLLCRIYDERWVTDYNDYNYKIKIS